MVVTAQTQMEDMTVSARWLSLVTVVKFVSSIMTLGMKHLKNLRKCNKTMTVHTMTVTSYASKNPVVVCCTWVQKETLISSIGLRLLII